MKGIIVPNCLQCPHWQPRSIGQSWCGSISRMLTEGATGDIPDWCPLPDVEKLEDDE